MVNYLFLVLIYEEEKNHFHRLYKDIIEIIFSYLNEKDRTRLTSCDKFLKGFKYLIIFKNVKILPIMRNYDFSKITCPIARLFIMENDFLKIITPRIGSLIITEKKELEYFEKNISEFIKLNGIKFNGGYDLFPNGIKKNILPDGLTKLNFGNKFQGKMEHLPRTLKKLSIRGKNYNQKFEKDTLPEGLEVLKLKRRTHGLKNLPRSLKILSIGNYNYNYKQKFEKDTLPEGLEVLELGGCSQELQYLPKTLKKLSIRGHYEYNFKKYTFPEGLEVLELREYGQELQYLPKNLKKLSIKDHYEYDLKKYTLPEGLEILKLPESYVKKLDYLPKSLKKLVVRGFEQKFEKNTLPEGLEVLKLGYGNDQKLENLPKSLKKISISYNHKSEEHNFPEGLIELELGYNFAYEKELLKYLPKSLKKLTVLNSTCMGQLEKEILPEGLKIIFDPKNKTNGWDQKSILLRPYWE